MNLNEGISLTVRFKHKHPTLFQFQLKAQVASHLCFVLIVGHVLNKHIIMMCD